MTSNSHYSSSHGVAAWLVAIAVALAPMVIPLSAHADGAQDQARKHYQAGRDLYSAGKYQDAIREFETANRLAPSPVLDFNIGLARERMGQLDKALQHYRAYVAALPNANNRAAVDAKIKSLEAEIAENQAKADVRPLEKAKPVSSAPSTDPSTTPSTDPSTDPSTAPSATTDGAMNPDGTTTDPIIAEPAGTDLSAATLPTATADDPASETAATGAVTPPSAPVYASTGDPTLDRVAQLNLAEIRDQRRGHMEAPPPVARGAGHKDFGKKKAKPVYKQWWFWVVVGVSAVILIDMANSGDDNGAAPPDALNGGPVLIRF